MTLNAWASRSGLFSSAICNGFRLITIRSIIQQQWIRKRSVTWRLGFSESAVVRWLSTPSISFRMRCGLSTEIWLMMLSIVSALIKRIALRSISRRRSALVRSGVNRLNTSSGPCSENNSSSEMNGISGSPGWKVPTIPASRSLACSDCWTRSRLRTSL